jgi:hypothetical protein
MTTKMLVAAAGGVVSQRTKVYIKKVYNQRKNSYEATNLMIYNYIMKILLSPPFPSAEFQLLQNGIDVV